MIYLLMAVVCFGCHGVDGRELVIECRVSMVTGYRVSIVNFCLLIVLLLPVPTSEDDLAFTLHTILFF